MARSARLWGPAAVFILLLTASCGGSGDGDGDGWTGPVQLYDTYALTITDMTSGPVFAVDFEMSGNDHRVELSHVPGMLGVLAIDPRTWTFNTGSSIVVDTDAGIDPIFGTYTMSVASTLVIPYDAPPTTGALRLDTLSFYSTLTFRPKGIDFAVDGGPPTFYSWSEFEDLNEDPTASDAERISSFALQVFRFMMERYDAVVDLLEQIRNTNDLEEGYNPRSLTGVPWPSGYTLVPDTIANPGTGSLGWNDRDFSDHVNSGDDLSWGLWEFRPNTNAEWMYDGGMTFQNLVLNINANIVRSVGFFTALGRTGGVLHDGMRIRQMDVDDGPMTVTEEGTLQLSGGFAFQLNPP